MWNFDWNLADLTTYRAARDKRQAGACIAEHRVDFGHAWLLALAVGFVAWIVLRTLKRRIQWLRVAGR